MVVPTLNRLHTLRLVAPSYCEQRGVTEIIFVSDGGTDGTPQLISELEAKYPAVRFILVNNPTRVGAAQSRNNGVDLVSNQFVLFCDDDEYLEAGYAQTCLRLLLEHDAACVSGRRVYMRDDGESAAEAVARFGIGWRKAAPFNHVLCEHVNAARFTGSVEVPFTNAIILTRTELARKFRFDAHYFEGKGYREESDYQMNLYCHGYKILMTNETHSIHLPLSAIRLNAGNARSRRETVYWCVKHTDYFYKKYWDRYASRAGIRVPRRFALLASAVFLAYRHFLRGYLVTAAFKAEAVAKNLRGKGYLTR